MSRSTATLTISLPPEMVDDIERVRKAERRTRSELVREALRQYVRAATVRAVKERAAALAEAEPTAEEVEAIRAGRRELRAVKGKASGRVAAPSRGSRPKRA